MAGLLQDITYHYGDVIMSTIASQITSHTIVYSTVYSDADQRKHQSSASLAFVWGIHRGPVNSPHKWPVTRKMFPFDDVITSVAKTITGCRADWTLKGHSIPGPYGQAMGCLVLAFDKKLFCIIVRLYWKGDPYFCFQYHEQSQWDAVGLVGLMPGLV